MNRIAELRKKNNLSQTELAERLKIAQNTLSQYENELRTPSSRVVLQLADLFGVTPNYLMGEAEPQAATQFTLQSITRVLREENVDRVNLYLRKGWRLLHVGEEKEVRCDGSGYSDIVYTLGWADDPRLSAAQPLPDNYSNEDENERYFYKICYSKSAESHVRVRYATHEPPDTIENEDEYDVICRCGPNGEYPSFYED